MKFGDPLSLEMEINLEEFQVAVAAEAKTFEEALRRGMEKAARYLLETCYTEAPTIPYDTGATRGSGTVYLDGKRVFDKTGTYPAGQGIAPGAMPPPTEAHVVEAIVGFFTDYASWIHEVPANFHFPGSGNYYLASKVDAHRAEITAIVQREIDEALR